MLGADLFEVLFSASTVHSTWKCSAFYLLALAYCCLHATSLLMQVMALNVAVNSYSNALLTLLISNQFVEIKSTVFKKFERANLFQLTCADVVERFQLCLMLVIIAARNLVQLGIESSQETTILPPWVALVASPLLLVLASEVAVDWLKHGYIIRFNALSLNVYDSFSSVLCQDYRKYIFTSDNT